MTGEIPGDHIPEIPVFAADNTVLAAETAKKFSSGLIGVDPERESEAAQIHASAVLSEDFSPRFEAVTKETAHQLLTWLDGVHGISLHAKNHLHALDKQYRLEFLMQMALRDFLVQRVTNGVARSNFALEMAAVDRSLPLAAQASKLVSEFESDTGYYSSVSRSAGSFERGAAAAVALDWYKRNKGDLAEIDTAVSKGAADANIVIGGGDGGPVRNADIIVLGTLFTLNAALPSANEEEQARRTHVLSRLGINPDLVSFSPLSVDAVYGTIHQQRWYQAGYNLIMMNNTPRTLLDK